ncbi:porin [Basilea psittacipulmonis]|uniref:Porin domain-containing protein n=1 Tax=Basilea psittacipulmonis DSM 24701 TaxID=1072685 RepID=A0A077DDS7_9BURK|nr:porin [Basilea psittacipulmonis]AIL33025.1 hypothetical protein IX83_06595 [Basilea psittacipulmonis DSM 24701]
MKKTLIAAAVVAGLAGVAQAESSVTLYGIVDGGLAYTYSKGLKADNSYAGKGAKVKSFAVSQDGAAASRFGLKGQEDLGNGLNAIFQLEGGFNLATGASASGEDLTKNGPLFARKAIIGLSGEGFGTLTAGRQNDVVDELAKGDVFGGNFGDDYSAFGALQGRSNSVVRYISPDLAGLKLGLSWSGDHKKVTDAAGDVDKTKADKLAAIATFDVDGLGLSAGYIYQRTNDGSDRAVNKQYSLGLEYDFEVLKVFARFERQKVEKADLKVVLGKVVSGGFLFGDVLGASEFKSYNYALGVALPVSESGTVLAGWQYTTGKYNGNDDAVRYNLFRVGYAESLSKRTTAYVYGGYGYAKQNGLGHTPKLGTVSIGLNHKF